MFAHAERRLLEALQRVYVSTGSRRSASSRSTGRTARREHWIVRTGRYARPKFWRFSRTVSET